MNNPIYQLKGTLYRSQDNLKDLIEIDEVFKDENPIEAREKALSKFQSYVDVLLQSKDLEQEHYFKTANDLDDFTNSYKKEFAFNNPDIETDDDSEDYSLEIEVDFDKGLFIYFITDPNDTYTTKEGELIYNKKRLIHCVDNNKFTPILSFVLASLRYEYRYYNKNGLDVKNSRCDIQVFSEDRILTILETPIEFKEIFGG